MVKGLPPDSAFMRRGRMWTQAHELAALAIERNEMWSLTWIAMNAAKGSRLPQAIALSHPDRAEKPKKTASVADVARMFG